MKQTVILSLSLFISIFALAQERKYETALFNAKGEPVAYINQRDTADRTIYLWDGKPVAYLLLTGNGVFDVYSFTGKHWGWFAAGILRNNEGDAVVVTKYATPLEVKAETAKARKQPKPEKSQREPAPTLHPLTSVWSNEPAVIFLQNQTY